MTYTDLLRACRGNAGVAYSATRAVALLPLIPSAPQTEMRARLRARGALYAALLKVPRRVLKRWSTRALRALPRGSRTTGPRLAMFKLQSLFPRCRRITRRRSKRLVSKVNRGGSTT